MRLNFPRILQKLIYYGDPAPKKINTSQFFIEVAILIFLLYFFQRKLFFECGDVNDYISIVFFIWGIIVYTHLAYYQATHITWEKGLNIYPMEGPIQIGTYSIIYLIPIIIYGC